MLPLFYELFRISDKYDRSFFFGTFYLISFVGLE